MQVLMVSYCGGWLFVVRRRVSCVVNVLSVDTVENPIGMKVLSRQYLISNLALDGSKSRLPRCKLRLALVTLQMPCL